MSRVTVLVPSRGRPNRAHAMYRSAMDTALGTNGGTDVFVIVDADDPTLPEYVNRGLPLRVLEERVRFTGSLNVVASELWDQDIILGAFGDDVLFRTKGWDRIVEKTLSTPGIAYGDDLIHGKNHPSAIFMSGVIAKSLGWLALPAVWHTWADDAWKRIGQETGCLRYMPEVIVEHMHYGVGKSEEDATYREVYSKETGDHDYPAFVHWQKFSMRSDLRRVRAALR